MKQVILPLVLTLAMAPAWAQVPAPQDGISLMERGARLMLDGLLAEVGPQLDDLGQSLREMEPALRAMGPALRDLVAMLGDVQNYDPPVKLPNGDILIRRKQADGPQIDL